MSETHFNAFLLEAAEKRAHGQRLLAEADALEAQVPAELKPAAAEAEKPKRVRKPAAKK